MLTIQYRMHRVISDWCSNAMYNGRLVADMSVATHLLSEIEVGLFLSTSLDLSSSASTCTPIQRLPQL
jgi:superfamily I DNA and/or RNA helicase